MTLEQHVTELLNIKDAETIIAAIRDERDKRKAAAKKELDDAQKALDERRKAAGLPIRGERKRTEKAGAGA